jgi:small neutral amino acid transporter SnatA (MarC family)
MRNCLRIARALSPAVMLTLGKIIAILLVGLSVELMFVGLNSWGVVSIAGLKASGG